MDLLFRLLAILVAARIAAEVAERLKLPAVLLEIAAGIALGPSLLGLVGDQEPLHFLGELGAILLLLEVGIHMDLADLVRVGRSATQVAAIGVAVPMVAAIFALGALGVEGQTGLFLAAGITATSVGITARVFADMRSLTTTEAQTVLGAAVADDVIGLLILTVVVRLAATGEVDLASIAAIGATGIGFVAVATALGAWLAPKLFDRLLSRARTQGALIGGAVAFTLAVAGLAAAARLAPIVGAFVAGIALGRIKEQEELRDRLAPLTHLFVPVFFLLIGAEAHLSAFTDPRTLVLIGVLGAVAVAGKLVAGLGAPRGKTDRMLIGIGMIPRGEVGLVFATLGLSSGVLGAREHAALLFVVLATTLIAPPWLRRRVERTRREALAAAVDDEPAGGWLADDGEMVELAAEPPLGLAAVLGLDAALRCANRRPGPKLLDWLARASAEPPAWNDDLKRRLFALLRNGNARSWRLLDVTGLLHVVLPDIGAAIRRRKGDAFDLDPSGALRWHDVEAVNEAARTPAFAAIWDRIDQEVVLVAALARNAFHGDGAEASAERLAATIGLSPDQVTAVGRLVADRELLRAAASRTSMGHERGVIEIADHVGTRSHLDALHLLANIATSDQVHREALRELHGLVTETLAHAEAGAEGPADLVAERVRRVKEGLREPALARTLGDAPRRYVLAHEPATIRKHLEMMETPLAKGALRLRLDPDPAARRWTVHAVTHDRAGTLAAIAHAFASIEADVNDASVSSWDNGLAVDVFSVSAPMDTDWGAFRTLAERLLNGGRLLGGERNGAPEPIDGTFHVDDAASPWHTIVEVRALDRHGLLYRVADALARAGVSIHHATVATVGGVAVDTFYVSDAKGHKLGTSTVRALRQAFEGRVVSRWSPRRVLERATKR